MRSYVVDLWYEDQEQDERFVMLNLDKAIEILSNPHPTIKLQNKVAELSEEDFEPEFEDN